MARQLYYRDFYGRVHRDRQAGGGVSPSSFTDARRSG
jgi:hypothetical protein